MHFDPPSKGFEIAESEGAVKSVTTPKRNLSTAEYDPIC
jgi:hypothetical protein